MNITFYRNTSEKNKIGKDLEMIQETTGTLKRSTDLVDPVITFELTENTVLSSNYLYIEEFNRFYFINDMRSLRNGLWEIICHVDVLESFKSQILSQQAIIARQENLWNLYQDDDMFKTYSQPILDEIAWKKDFSHWKYFVALSGSIAEEIEP